MHMTWLPLQGPILASLKNSQECDKIEIFFFNWKWDVSYLLKEDRRIREETKLEQVEQSSAGWEVPNSI